MAIDSFTGESGRERVPGLLRLLGPLAPAGVRRAARMERLAEEVSRALGLGGGSGLPDGAFDPNLGASGRPPAAYAHPGGPRNPEPAKVKLSEVHYWDPTLRWSGKTLTIAQEHRRSRPIPLPLAPPTAAAGGAGADASGQVAEVALFVSAWAGWNPRKPAAFRRRDPRPPEPWSGWDPRRPPPDGRETQVLYGSLHFLNAEGYAVLVAPQVRCAWREIAEVVQAAGLPFRVYAFACPGRTAEEIAGLLFPRRRGGVMLGE
jgi:hypothetical protein